MTPNYKYATYCPEANAWFLPKPTLSALIEHCSKDDSRRKLQHVVFTDHSIGATDGHRLILLTQKGSDVYCPSRCHVVSRDVLIRARACIQKPHLERAVIRLEANRSVEVQRWRSGDKISGDKISAVKGEIMAELPTVLEVRVAEDGWGWTTELRKLVEDAEKPGGGRNKLNPAYFDAVMKTCKWVGFSAVEAFFGSGGAQPTVFEAGSRYHTLDLTMLVMGMV
jgi:hypothetical protein